MTQSAEFTRLVAKTDQELANSWEFMDDFRRINQEGPNDSERDMFIMRMACGLIFVSNCSSAATAGEVL